MGRKRNKPVTPTQTSSVPNETIVNSPVVLTHTISESDLNMNPELKDEGVKVGDIISFDNESEIIHTSDKDVKANYTSIWNFFQKNEINYIPVNFLINFDIENCTFNGIDSKPYNYFEQVGRGVNYCKVVKTDIHYEIKTRKETLLCIPSKYDIVNEGTQVVAIFSESGKLNFKDIFNYETMSLKTGL